MEVVLRRFSSFLAKKRDTKMGNASAHIFPLRVLDARSLVGDSHIAFPNLLARLDSARLSVFGVGVHISTETVVVVRACTR